MTDQKASIIDIASEESGSIIENELPTYRAISAIAILSVVCGGLAIFCFAHPFFYVFLDLGGRAGHLGPSQQSGVIPTCSRATVWPTPVSPWDCLRTRLGNVHDCAAFRPDPPGREIRQEVRGGPQITRRWAMCSGTIFTRNW